MSAAARLHAAVGVALLAGAAAGIALVEFGAQGGSLAPRLPAPLAPLPVAKGVTSNASKAGSPAGTFQAQVFWRSQSGDRPQTPRAHRTRSDAASDADRPMAPE